MSCGPPSARVLRDRPVLNFLLAYWLYIDGINTVQLMAVDFGTKLGFSTTALIQALLLVQFIAFPVRAAVRPARRSHRYASAPSISGWRCSSA